ncbi:MAG: hypothetical protein V5A21_04880 [Halapricum sp.]
MAKPFVLDDDGGVSIVGPPGLERFLGEDEQTGEQPGSSTNEATDTSVADDD